MAESSRTVSRRHSDGWLPPSEAMMKRRFTTASAHRLEHPESRPPALLRTLSSHCTFTAASVAPDVTVTDPTTASGKKRFTRREIVTLGSLCFGQLCGAMFYSLLAPFFPLQAKAKGASPTQIGLIFAVFQLIVFVMSPVLGNFMGHIGAKFMFISGITVCSMCGIFFGILEWCPGGATYVTMCFLIRSVEAIGSAALNTANMAVASHTFPEKVGTAVGILEAFSCIGLMVGPPIGGVLYDAGGFYLPFVVCGLVFLIGGIMAIIVLPSTSSRNANYAKVRLLRIPVVIVVGLLVAVAQAAIGFIDVGLSIFLSSFKLTPTIVGVTFLIPSAVVVVLAPLYGHLADKYKKYRRLLLIIGSFIGGAAFLVVGPTPLVPPLPTHKLWLVMLSLAISAVGWASVILTYSEFIAAASKSGLPDNIETHGIVSGVYNAFNSIGAFVGPLAGGYLIERLEFRWASTVIGGMIVFAVLLLIVYSLTEYVCCRDRDLELENLVDTKSDECEPLLQS